MRYDLGEGGTVSLRDRTRWSGKELGVSKVSARDATRRYGGGDQPHGRTIFRRYDSKLFVGGGHLFSPGRGIAQACFPSFISEFSSSYGYAAFPSQSLHSASLLVNSVHFSGWVTTSLQWERPVTLDGIAGRAL